MVAIEIAGRVGSVEGRAGEAAEVRRRAGQNDLLPVIPGVGFIRIVGEIEALPGIIGIDRGEILAAGSGQSQRRPERLAIVRVRDLEVGVAAGIHDAYPYQLLAEGPGDVDAVGPAAQVERGCRRDAANAE